MILLAEELAATKVVSCVTGGATRADGSGRARGRAGGCPRRARPRRRPASRRRAVIERLLASLAGGFDGVVPAVAIPDTVKRVDGSVVVETLDRDDLVGAQTPQAFLAPSLRRAFAGDLYAATDCATLVERAGGRVAVVAGTAGS